MRRDRRRIIVGRGSRDADRRNLELIFVARELTKQRKKMVFALLILPSALQLAPHAVLGPGLSISTDTVTANCAIPAGAELLRVEETRHPHSRQPHGTPAAARGPLAERLLAAPARDALLASSDRAPLHAWSDEELELLQSPRCARRRWRARRTRRTTRSRSCGSTRWWRATSCASSRRCAVRALRSTGATLTRCEATGDLVLLKDATSESVAVSSGWRTNDELPPTEGWADPALRSDAALTLNDCVGAADVAFGAASASCARANTRCSTSYGSTSTCRRRPTGRSYPGNP